MPNLLLDSPIFLTRISLDLDDENPTRSPDGKRIASESDRDGNNEIYVMNADGTNQKNLTNSPANDRDPDWCCQALQLTESTQPEGGLRILFSPFEGLLPWELVILVASLMMILIIFLRQKAILREK
jgi:hypothetical protein